MNSSSHSICAQASPPANQAPSAQSTHDQAVAKAAAKAAAAAAAAAKRTEQLNTKHSKSLTKYFKDLGSWKRYAIKTVKVDGGNVTIQTDLWPKADNNPFFMGACTSAHDGFDWVKWVNVKDSGGGPAADWSDGNVSCHLYN